MVARLQPREPRAYLFVARACCVGFDSTQFVVSESHSTHSIFSADLRCLRPLFLYGVLKT